MLCSDRPVLRPTTDTELAWSLGPNTPTNINNQPVSPREGDKKVKDFLGEPGHLPFGYDLAFVNGRKRPELQWFF